MMQQIGNYIVLAACVLVPVLLLSQGAGAGCLPRLFEENYFSDRLLAHTRSLPAPFNSRTGLQERCGAGTARTASSGSTASNSSSTSSSGGG